MSVSSYRRNVANGHTGPTTSTCFPAALEQLSPRHAFSGDVYQRYRDTVDIVCSLEGQGLRKVNPMLKDLYGYLATELGYAYGDIAFERLRTIEEFRERVCDLLASSSRVVVDIMTEGCHGGAQGYVHSVGISVVGSLCDQMVRLRSTWLPSELAGVIPLDSVFPHLAQLKDPPRQRYEFNDANLAALPD